MGLTNRQENEINFCEFQISWREQNLIPLESEFKNTKWRSDAGILNEQGLWDATQKIGKLKDEIKKYKDRLIEIRGQA